jgi:CubicO group peptidase (beta-lactamase class C family)
LTAARRSGYHGPAMAGDDAVVANATAEAFDAYFNRVLRDRIGLDGMWIWSGNDHVYYSTARGLGRFGLLVLNNGKWGEGVVMRDSDCPCVPGGRLGRVWSMGRDYRKSGPGE